MDGTGTEASTIHAVISASLSLRVVILRPYVHAQVKRLEADLATEEAARAKELGSRDSVIARVSSDLSTLAQQAESVARKVERDVSRKYVGAE